MSQNNGLSILDCLQAVAQPLGKTPVLPDHALNQATTGKTPVLPDHALNQATTDAPPQPRIEGTLHLPKHQRKPPKDGNT